MTEQLQEMKARLGAVTPGPWSVSLNNARTANLLLIHSGTEQEDRLGEIFEDDDADFIAHAPEDLAKLIAALEAVLNLANHEPRFRPRMYGGEYFPVNVSADEIIEVIAEALA